MPQPQTDGGRLDVSDVKALLLEYHPRVYNYIRYRVADPAEAEDLTSDILERALRHLSSYDARRGAFSTWLFRIAHNTWVNHIKKGKRRLLYHADFSSAVEDLPSGDPTPEQGVESVEEKAQLMRCLNTLPDRQQEILSLRFAGRMTNREIGRVLHMNERTVSVTILRALRKLRRQLAESEGI
jgi:RNA polymerase sigma-70 factor, ECF subfamily